MSRIIEDLEKNKYVNENEKREEEEDLEPTLKFEFKNYSTNEETNNLIQSIYRFNDRMSGQLGKSNVI